VGCAYGRGAGMARAAEARAAEAARTERTPCVAQTDAARAGAGCMGPRTVRSAQAPQIARRMQHAQGARAAHDACGAAKAIAIQRHMSKTKVHKTTNSRILYCIMLHFKIIHFHIFHNPISNFSGSPGRVCSSWKCGIVERWNRNCTAQKVNSFISKC
jgi:hypothetical protein